MSSANHGHGHGEEGASAESVKVGFEVADWQFRPVWILTIASLSSVVLAFIVMGVLIFVTGGTLGDQSHTLLPTGEARLPPAPRLEQNPNLDGPRIVAEATARLESVGWADDGQTVAHIPIDRAMELLLAKGIRPFEEGATTGEAPAPTAPANSEPVVFDAALAAQGEQIFTNLGCVGCHRGDGAGIGPSLEGLVGRERPLEGGGSVTADETYLNESILNSTAKVAEGYSPVMPPYQGQLSNEQVAQLIEYIKSLSQ
jgi:mono/diheme cytochrome c family protein